MRVVAAIAVLLASAAAGVFMATRERGPSREDRAAPDRGRLEIEIGRLPSSIGGAPVTASDIAADGTLAFGTARGELWLQERTSDAPRRRATRVGDGSPIARVAFSGAGTALAALTANGWLWAWQVGTPVAATSRIHPSVLDDMDVVDSADPAGNIVSIAVTSDLRYVAAAAFNVVLFDLQERRHLVFEQELDRGSYGGEYRTGAPFEALAVTDTDVVAANVSGVDTWRTSGGRARPVFKCDCSANGVSVSADGRVVAYGTGDGHALLFDVRTQNQLADKTISTKHHVFTASAASPPRRAAAVREPNGVVVWDPAAGRTLGLVRLPQTPDRVALSADGRTMLAEAGRRRWRVVLG